MTLKRSFAINVSSSLISTLFVVMNESRKISYPVIHSSVHEIHDGEKFESLPHSTCKLHPF